jgi:hypothetical protein
VAGAATAHRCGQSLLLIVIVIVSGSEKAAEMLLEADAGVSGDASGIGIEGQHKILDLFLDLSLLELGCLNARRNHLPGLDLVGLDLVMHFPFHPYSSPRKLRWSIQA